MDIQAIKRSRCVNYRLGAGAGPRQIDRSVCWNLGYNALVVYAKKPTSIGANIMFNSKEDADNAAELGAEAIQKLMLTTSIWLHSIGFTDRSAITNETLLELQRMFCDSIMPLLQRKTVTPKVIGFIQRKMQ